MKKFKEIPSVLAFAKGLLKGNRCHTTRTLRQAHVGCGAQDRIKEGRSLSVGQLYSLLRYLVAHETTPRDKLLMAMRFLDHLERDYRDVYPEDGEPIAGGYEETLRRLTENTASHRMS